MTEYTSGGSLSTFSHQGSDWRIKANRDEVVNTLVGTNVDW